MALPNQLCLIVKLYIIVRNFYRTAMEISIEMQPAAGNSCAPVFIDNANKTLKQ